jgi:predicted nucleotidyltransferase
VDKNAAIDVIGRFRSALDARGLRHVRIVLFGSYAEGTQHEGSDIDVVVISDEFAGMDYWERIRILAQAICDIFEPIEAVAMTTEEWERGDSLIAQYAKNGVAIT